MRWPFVSRRAFDIEREALAAQRDFTAQLVHELAKEQQRSKQIAAAAAEQIARVEARAAEQLEKEQQRSDQLLNTVLDMRMSGGTVQRLSPLAAEQRHMPPRRSDVDQAIDENKYASSNPLLRAHLSTWAEREFAKRPDDDAHTKAVIQRLRTWSAPVASDEDDEKE